MPEISRTAPITRRQIAAVKSTQRRRGIPDGEYRALLRARWGVESCTALTRRQASDLLRLLGRPLARRPGEQPPRPPRPRPAPTPPGVTPLPTPGQRRLITDLAREIRWATPEGYVGWLRASQGLERVLTLADAHRVIEGLLAIRRRRGEPAA